MDGDKMQPVRDDSAWPREADNLSVLIGSATLMVGILAVANHDRPAVAALFLLLALLLGGSLIMIAMRRWLSGRAIPASLGVVGVLLLLGGAIAMNLVVGSGGFPIVASGLVSGMMLANLWAIGVARARRSSHSDDVSRPSDPTGSSR